MKKMLVHFLKIVITLFCLKINLNQSLNNFDLYSCDSLSSISINPTTNSNRSTIDIEMNEGMMNENALILWKLNRIEIYN